MLEMSIGSMSLVEMWESGGWVAGGVVSVGMLMVVGGWIVSWLEVLGGVCPRSVPGRGSRWEQLARGEGRCSWSSVSALSYVFHICTYYICRYTIS